jgi:drug/metabolite transporter (DMT)-like permease
MKTTARGPLLIALLALVWGSNFLWIKLSLEAFSPVQVTFGRMILGALVLLVVILVRREKLPSGWRIWGHLFVAALVANAAPYLLFALGEQYVGSGIAGALNATTPLWTLLLVVAVRQQRTVRLPQLTGLVAGFVGCLLIFSPWQEGHVDLLGAGYCLVASISYAISYLYMSRHLASRDITPTVLSTAQLIAATGWTVLALPFDRAPIPRFSVLAWSALAVLGTVGTGLAYIINYALVRSEGAIGASVVTYLVPVASVGLGVLVLSEPGRPALIGGTLLVLIGVALVVPVMVCERTYPPDAGDHEVTGRDHEKSADLWRGQRIGGGQGRDRTGDLPLFRSPDRGFRGYGIEHRTRSAAIRGPSVTP